MGRMLIERFAKMPVTASNGFVDSLAHAMGYKMLTPSIDPAVPPRSSPGCRILSGGGRSRGPGT